jgi:hypothetical protein
MSARYLYSFPEERNLNLNFLAIILLPVDFPEALLPSTAIEKV